MDNDGSSKDGYYPFPAFYFQVKFIDFPGQDTAFQEVSGISVNIEYEPVAEGGENFFYYLPKQPKYSNLILKRGIAGASSPLVDWCSSILGPDFSKPIKPRDLQVFLLNEEGDFGKVWNIFNALPVQWKIDPFNSIKNNVAIETIELSYQYFT
jgi:phage tail-like protein